MYPLQQNQEFSKYNLYSNNKNHYLKADQHQSSFRNYLNNHKIIYYHHK
jgi:hypothetical protein